ncbi:hypothetical protein TBLA_0F03420 [Henningerozyma blattae CBS 6284]|uniref:Rho-GAP domain-containing protein n=1 Tax=Henningerozyma blattae (strain ATCC 34711 / CBS 6284 / DSM 70876 / NBRC 10599 / NRRL Y-10934 / UCD 77-7) TaxID=1071380 RepID=I2H677_HENB6|nr:hypothetical protein TBLA_0F03420 [Tetrapisispora blattae CBS 6284]CCH61879.1 hypothetical protein TBLA_0F03420 [Tetrapisispora blattae CBS 6284]
MSVEELESIKEENILESKEINLILTSDIAAPTLLTKFKDLLLYCEELSKYFRKKYLLEIDNSENYSKYHRQFFNINDVKVSADSTLINFTKQILTFDEKFAQVKLKYANSLDKISNELNSLLLIMTRLRKSIKEKSRKLEKNLMDSINDSKKSKNRYDSLCQTYLRLLNDNSKTKLTLRGSKTHKEQQDELQKKIDASIRDYKSTINISKNLRKNYIEIEKPKLISELKNLIIEMSMAMTMQLKKYTFLTENMFLQLGLSISPIGEKSTKSMKTVVNSIDYEKDLYNFLNKFNSPTKKHSLLINTDLVPLDLELNSLVPSSENVKTSSSARTKKKLPMKTKNGLAKRMISTENESPFSSTNYSSSSISSPSGSVKHIRSMSPLSTNSHKPLKKVTSHNSHAQSSSPNTSRNSSNTSSKSKITNDIIPPASIIQSNSNPRESAQSDDHFISLDPKPDYSQDLDTGFELILSQINEEFHFSSDESSKETTELDISIKKVPLNNNILIFGSSLEETTKHDNDTVPIFVEKCIEFLQKNGAKYNDLYDDSFNIQTVESLITEINNDPKSISTVLRTDKIPTKEYVFKIAKLFQAYFVSLPETLLPPGLEEEFKQCLNITYMDTKIKYMHGILYKLPEPQYWTLRELLFHFKFLFSQGETHSVTINSICSAWADILIPSSLEDSDPKKKEFQKDILNIIIETTDQAFEAD